jgi:AraC-like DNA-binding protein
MPQVPPARYLLRAKDFVDARYAEPITVEDLAAAAGLSRAHFSRMFTKTFGESPRAYLQSRRLERAAALLRYTDRSVAEICVMVGLQSIGSFTSSFARVFGKPRRHTGRACRRPLCTPGCRAAFVAVGLGSRRLGLLHPIGHGLSA